MVAYLFYWFAVYYSVDEFQIIDAFASLREQLSVYEENMALLNNNKINILNLGPALFSADRDININMIITHRCHSLRQEFYTVDPER